MPKVSQLPSDQTPATTDYVAGVQSTGGPVTKSFSLASLINFFFNNVPNASIKTPALALSAALDGTNGVKSVANTGSAGGTIWYVNLGGIKLLWALSANQNVTSAGIQPTFTLPAGFFSTIQAAISSPSDMTGTANMYSNVAHANSGGVAYVQVSSTGTGTTVINLFMIGT